jgi:hypothetical protein
VPAGLGLGTGASVFAGNGGSCPKIGESDKGNAIEMIARRSFIGNRKTGEE